MFEGMLLENKLKTVYCEKHVNFLNVDFTRDVMMHPSRLKINKKLDVKLIT